MSGASVDVVLDCQIQILNPNGSIFQIPTRCDEGADAACGEGPGGAEGTEGAGGAAGAEDAEGAKGAEGSARPV